MFGGLDVSGGSNQQKKQKQTKKKTKHICWLWERRITTTFMFLVRRQHLVAWVIITPATEDFGRSSINSFKVCITTEQQYIQNTKWTFNQRIFLMYFSMYFSNVLSMSTVISNWPPYRAQHLNFNNVIQHLSTSVTESCCVCGPNESFLYTFYSMQQKSQAGLKILVSNSACTRCVLYQVSYYQFK